MNILKWDELENEIKNYDIIINATSLGLKDGDDFNFNLIRDVSPSFPKKNFLALFSIPTMSKPFFEKNSADSDPTKPQEPVIKAIFI